MSRQASSLSAVTAIVIGAGNRGYCYSSYMKEAPDDFQVIFIMWLLMNIAHIN